MADQTHESILTNGSVPGFTNQRGWLAVDIDSHPRTNGEKIHFMTNQTGHKGGLVSAVSRLLRGRRSLLLLGVVVLTLGLIASVSVWLGAFDKGSPAYALAPESALPANIRQAPPNVRDAYRFAIANRDILSQIPCYCGCGTERHKSNADCYIKDVKPDGSVVFDPMSFG